MQKLIKEIEVEDKKKLDILAEMLDSPVKCCVIFEGLVFSTTLKKKPEDTENIDDLVDFHSKEMNIETDEYKVFEDNEKS